MRHFSTTKQRVAETNKATGLCIISSEAGDHMPLHLRVKENSGAPLILNSSFLGSDCSVVPQIPPSSTAYPTLGRGACGAYPSCVCPPVPQINKPFTQLMDLLRNI